MPAEGGGPGPRVVLARKVGLAAGLGVASGYIDVVTIERYGCFAAMQTGNAVFLGLKGVQVGGADAGFYASVMLSSVVGAALMERHVHRHPRHLVVIAVPVVFALICASDLISARDGGSRWVVCLVALCMGAQNTLSMQGALKVNTTILTGGLQRIGLALSQLAHGDAIAAAERESLLLCAAVVLATPGGAVLGALMLRRFGQDWSLIAPALLQAGCKLLYARWFVQSSERRPAAAREAAPADHAGVLTTAGQDVALARVPDARMLDDGAALLHARAHGADARGGAAEPSERLLAGDYRSVSV